MASSDETPQMPVGIHLVDGVPMSTDFHPLEHLQMIKSWSLNPQDVLVAGYPKSGKLYIILFYSS